MSDPFAIAQDGRALSPAALKRVLPDLRLQLYELAKQAHQQRLPIIVVFEGWDGSGKNRTIRELSRCLDPRGFHVRETHPPKAHEIQKPWLWRFWMQIPRRGQIAIFDRSWYGRVLVERVAGITPIPDWIRAYEEINAFERTLADDGTIFVKLWLHIDRDEQLRRFIRWSRDPASAWQIAAEDWDHHREYDSYLAAARDVMTTTDQPAAPWRVLAANDEAYTTYAVFRAIIERLEQALGCEPSAWPDPAQLEADVKRTTRSGRRGKRKSKRLHASGNETAAEADGWQGSRDTGEGANDTTEPVLEPATGARVEPSDNASKG